MIEQASENTTRHFRLFFVFKTDITCQGTKRCRLMRLLSQISTDMTNKACGRHVQQQFSKLTCRVTKRLIQLVLGSGNESRRDRHKRICTGKDSWSVLFFLPD